MSTQTPCQIAFEDIRKGDEIRVERPAAVGIRFMREGVAHKSTHDGWFTSEGGLIVSANSEATITLLHRPTVTEPTGLGAVVRAAVGESLADPHTVRTLVRTASPDLPWVDEGANGWAWSDFDPESIEVLPEGIEVES